jgi:hypothetical protein
MHSPDMIVRGAIHGSYPGVDIVARSRAHYGFQLSNPFENGDPEWSRQEDHWDNIDQCGIRVSWKVQKVSRGILWNLTLADRVSRTSFSTLMPMSPKKLFKS